MKSKVQKWGNSLAVRIPKPFADETGLGPNASIQMMIDEGAIVIRPDSENRWTLASLLAGVTDDNIHGESRDEPSARHSPVAYIHGRVRRK